MNRKFKLKPGKVIMLHGCTPITDKATDEQLINLLKLSPAHIAHFESYPDDWETLCGKKQHPGSQYEEDSSNDEEEDVDSQDDTSDEDSNDEDNAQEEEEDDNSNDGDDSDNEERKNELLEMSNNDLKEILIEMKQELPKKANKANLVDAIIEAEANS